MKIFITLLCLCSFHFLRAQLKADFTISVTSGCTPLLVQFKDSSSGNPTTIEWNLGNGSTSHVEAPQVIYDVAGTYNIKLVISDGATKDSITKTVVVYAKPSVDFSGTPLTGCPPLHTQFTGNISPGSGNVAASLWDFGDGQIFSGNNPNHTYTSSGSYGVTLTVTNSYGCKQTAFKDAYVNPDPSASAGFTYSYNNACVAPTNVSFTSAASTVANAAYQWQFNDGSTSADKNPQHVFQQKGNYTVKLTTTSPNGCIDTSSKTISIGSVTADFIIPSFCAGAPATFINNSTPAPVSATWNFSDGGSANTIDATHTFNTAGNYTVTMTGQFGACSGSVTKTIQVAGKANPSFTVSANANGCSYPRAVTFTNTSAGAVNYKWFFGDGDSSLQANPSHIYNTPGEFTVTLIAYNNNGCGDSLIKDSAVQISPPQITGFSNLPARGCVPFTVKPQAIIYSPEPVSFYEWDFGDGQKSNNAIPEHIYTAQGYYKVTLIVRTASGCSDTLSLVQAVSAGNLATPDFKADSTNSCAQTPISFTDLSTGKITSWTWDFGDGDRSSLQNPTHAYADTGYFTVILYLSNTGCPSQLIKKNYIHIKPPVAVIQTNYLCDAANEVNFLNKSIDAEDWKWEFGDAQTSVEKNPTHPYSKPGEYFVTLTVTNKSCTASVVDTVNIIKGDIHFTYLNPAEICHGNSITFSADTAAYVQNYTWNFGDNQTKDNDQNIKHVYDSSGVFNPFLIVKYINGCKDTVQAPGSVKVYGAYAILDSVTKNVCTGKQITFANKSISDGIHNITNYLWNFGDGKQQTFAAEPFTHVYDSAGIFPVSLIITDTYGCKDSAFKDSAVLIDNLKADFTISDSLSCTPSPVTFNNLSNGNTLTYLWNFGDGATSTVAAPQHRFLAEGIFDVALKVTDKNGCTDSLTKSKSITIKDPVAAFNLTDTFAICPPLLVQPENKSVNYDSLRWNFDDNATSTLANPLHNYTQGGTYNISLIAKGYGNCYDTAYKKLVLQGPSGQFIYSPLSGCGPLPVSFKAQTKNTVKYLWDFGNGVVPSTTVPFTNYQYTDAGIYVPKLIIADAVGCTVNVSNADSIRVTAVQARFGFSLQQSCDSSLVLFSDSSVISFDTAKSYNWNFGDGTSSSEINPSHYYKNSGAFNVSLQVLTNAGCSSTFTIPVQSNVHAKPVLNIDAVDSICVNSITDFNATNTAKDTVTAWQWNFGDGATASSQHATHAFSKAGTYKVTCIAVTNNGCTDTASKNITVVAAPLVDAGSDTVICNSTSIQLQATGADSYTWAANSSLSCTTCSSPVASPATTTTYSVIGKNNFGCTATDAVIVKVNQPFTLNVLSPDTLCAGNSVQLFASGAEVYNWQPAQGLSNTSIANPFASPTVTTIYTVTGSDSLNCFTQTKNVTVQVFPKPVFNITDSLLTVNIGTSTTITTTSSPDIIKWQWQPQFGLSCTDCAQPVARPQSSVTYTATATNAGGCTAQDYITFKVLCNGGSIFIPNTFSPNNDGVNDKFFPRSNADFQIRSFRVFNRWGTEVFEKLNPSPGNPSDGWDGNFSGKPAPEDVYIYMIEISCTSTVYPVKGTVTLIR